VSENRKNIKLKGIPASEGIVAGPAYVMSRARLPIVRKRISARQLNKEIKRLRRAIERAGAELNKVKVQLGKQIAREPFSIIDAHLLLIQDRALWAEVEERIKEEKINAEWALRNVINKWLKIFAGFKDSYLRERGYDLEVVGERILSKLAGHRDKDISSLEEPVIVIASDLRPDQTAQMIFSKVLGFATEAGSRTSHTAIVARSLEIPAVVGVERITELVEDGEIVILDGIEGEALINPEEKFCGVYQEKKAKWEAINQLLQEYAHPPSQTQDGHKIELSANLEILDEINFLKKYGAEGVGLYRTEYLYLDRERALSEEEHFENYQRLAEAVKPYSAVIRTFDLGGDKFASEPKLAEEMNPALGLRAIRFCLESPEIFKTQLRGILRASAYGEVQLLFPLISSMEEVREVKRLLKEVMGELEQAGKKFNPEIPIGVMIEVPSAALIAEQLAEEVDFFSIGTNDLIQYVLAIDRVNEYVSYLYQPLHPAVLKMIKQTVDAGHKAGIKVAMCGEMAGDVQLLPALISLGLDQLSMPARFIPMVRKVLKGLNAKNLSGLAEELIKFSSGEEVKRFLEEKIEREWKDAYQLELNEKLIQRETFICQKTESF